MEVKGLGSQGRMELTGLAVHAGTVVVEDPVRDIGRLLDLGEQDAATDGVDTACREVEDIAGLHGMVGQHLGDAAVLDALLVFVGGDGLAETGIEVGTFVGLDDVPHLGLAHLTVFALGHRVVGVDLDAEVFAGVNELDEQGQLAVVLLAHGLAKNSLRMLVDDGNEVVALPGTIADDAGAGGDGADLPALADGVGGGLQALVGAEAGAAPYNLMKVGFE